MKIIRVVKHSLGIAALAGMLLVAAPRSAHAGVFISVGIAPPPIPVYVQPPIPGDGYIWTPGYWAWNGDGYVWVDGAWVMPPYVGALWTPGYWGWGNGGYFWNAGYWGPTIGYYGGINYGFGYFGTGFYGGYWHHRRFCYNRAYNNFGHYRGFHGVYNRPYNGYVGRPGGHGLSYASRVETRHFDGNRGATINGRNFGNHNFPSNGSQHSIANNGHGFANGQQHNVPAQNRGNFAAGNHGGAFANQHNVPANSFNHSQTFEANNGMRSYNRGNNTRSFSQPAQRSYNMPNRSFAQPNRSFGNQSRSYSTPMARPNFGGNSGGFHGNAGSFHSNMGGGGGFHGGNMGGGFHGGGGGGFHGGGGGFHGGRR
ncbi:MAG TPA: YXWGXW repeat-containing protein [Edaphobacter sp.]|nr:YXWGXW repeat-containing protein [Edaphobacter sp.]